MLVTAIEAANQTPLVKNLKTGESYPHVYEVNSYEQTADNLEQLLEILKTIASKGHALVTGQLTHTLVSESRAGKSKQTDLEYLVIDVDSDELPYDSRNQFMQAIGFDCDYIFQHSASSKYENSLRGHYFVQLEEPVSPAEAKNYLKHLNFEHLKKYLKLSGSKMALKWPLDITVNDNGRIIYIAPPIQDHDPIQDRFILEQRAKSVFRIPKTEAVDAMPLINQLRAKEELPIKDVKDLKAIMRTNPDEIKITGIKENGKFVYLNLNGGDSWGYYFPINNPSVVGNFKGEPRFYLHDIDQEMYNRYIGQVTPLVKAKTDPEITPMIFRDPKADIYYQVLYDKQTNALLEFYPTNSKDRANDFLQTRGLPKMKVVPDGIVEFDPENLTQVDPSVPFLNQFMSTPYLEIQECSTEIPPYIDKVLRHITVTGECYDRFLNWLAYIYQFRKKTGTAWLFHGHTGTGKGTLFANILRPIFGHNQCKACTTENILDQFNDGLRNNLITFLDEFNINDINRGGKDFNKIKNYITEPYITIRPMHSRQITVKNFSNFIISTNELTPIKIDKSERRLNIPPRQRYSLEGLPDFRDLIEGELEQFCKFLRGYQVREKEVHVPIMNDARNIMIANSRTSQEDFFDALHNGDLEFFIDYGGDARHNPSLFSAYETVLENWVLESAKPTGELTREDIYIAYKYIIDPSKDVSPIKFAAICRNNGVDFTKKTINGNRKYTFPVRLTTTDEYKRADEPKNNVIPIYK